MITRSGESVGMVQAGGDGSSIDPNAHPRSFVSSDYYIIIISPVTRSAKRVGVR